MYYELYNEGKFVALLKVKDIAKRLGKATSTINNAAKKGTLISDQYKVVKSSLTPSEAKRLLMIQEKNKPLVKTNESQIVKFVENTERTSSGRTFMLPVWK